jgi:hypothetical protein
LTWEAFLLTGIYVIAILSDLVGERVASFALIAFVFAETIRTVFRTLLALLNIVHVEPFDAKVAFVWGRSAASSAKILVGAD